MTAVPVSIPRCVWEVGAEPGEGPVWVAHERALHFVDIVGHAIHRWKHDGERRSWQTPAEPGFVFATTDGRLV